MIQAGRARGARRLYTATASLTALRSAAKRAFGVSGNPFKSHRTEVTASRTFTADEVGIATEASNTATSHT